MVKICNTHFCASSEEENIEKSRFFFNDEHFTFHHLSNFQKFAIHAILNDKNVLVTAPTGSGKTLPAEFAIRYFTNKGKKVIYTSPIKALSNQKYYEFSKKYPDISFSLITGDIKLNPNGQVLIMTLEILMNYLFQQQQNTNTNTPSPFIIDIENELSCVVFDEIHYIQDKERGGNWENTIMMMPKHVQMIGLSATIDKPEVFSKWIETCNPTKEVFLCSTSHRIVPLTHYCFLTTNEAIFKKIKDKGVQTEIKNNTNQLLLLQNAKGGFQEMEYHKIKKTLNLFEKNQVFLKRKCVLNNLVCFLKNNDMLPALAFVFSRKQAEICAKEITMGLLEDDSKIPYTIKYECDQIIRKLPNFKEYLELPEYLSLICLLEKGIGVHHSGMMPILREIVELMISKKYIKLLFATESFSIGLDCPIKTTIFTGISKFDGNHHRMLHPHEYTQSAGRAGRRGVDTVGHVVHCNNLFALPSLVEYKTMLNGTPQSLKSQFHVSYSLILNLVKKGVNTDFTKYMQKSLLFKEINDLVISQKQRVQKWENTVEENKKRVSLMKTPEMVCEEFLDVLKKLEGGGEHEGGCLGGFKIKETTQTQKTQIKNKKEWEKQKERLLLQYSPDIEKDGLFYDQYLKNMKTTKQEKEHLIFLENTLEENTEKVCSLLVEERFLEVAPSLKLSELGVMASFVSEMHSLIFALFVQKTNYFEYFSVVQMVGFLSIFTDVKVVEENKSTIPKTKDGFLKSCIADISLLYEKFDDMEFQRNMQTGSKYKNALNYDMVDSLMEWCDCNDELQCKLFIQTHLTNNEISIGDFVKCVLKISTMVKEIINIAEYVQNIEWLHKLSLIDECILKYITINQSLYI